MPPHVHSKICQVDHTSLQHKSLGAEEGELTAEGRRHRVGDLLKRGSALSRYSVTGG